MITEKCWRSLIRNNWKEFFEGETNAYVMDLHNGDILEIHFASVIGRLCHPDGSSEYVYIQGMEEYLDSVFAE